LADEVGLGKTIEAGLLLAQRWAERKRKLLVILPANLRKQWNQEFLQMCSHHLIEPVACTPASLGEGEAAGQV
jgi:SNF2 family DNA or RNA helicase